ncbi:MAG TPA: YraN family protein [Candidatus Dormibacteraeota bacterium]|jgi:putative endonuclease|nr:YraN family protein [Candidatus Dormibacteraeota bacterium]
MEPDPSAVERAGRSRAVGARGEDLAVEILKGRGYLVVKRGFRARRGELDLICEIGGEMVVVEVKTRTSDRFGYPAEAVDQRKSAAMWAAISELRSLSGWKGAVRVAVLSIHLDRDGRVVGEDLVLDPD